MTDEEKVYRYKFLFRYEDGKVVEKRQCGLEMQKKHLIELVLCWIYQIVEQ